MGSIWRKARKSKADIHGCYYLPAPDNSLAPRYYAGEFLMIDPDIPLETGHFGVFWFRNRGYALARYHGRNSGYLKLQYNLLAQPIWVSARFVLSAHKILGCMDPKQD